MMSFPGTTAHDTFTGRRVWPPEQHFPGPQPEPTYIPPAPRGHWEWIPYDDGMCDACRRTGICMCVRPRFTPVYSNALIVDETTSVGFTVTSSGASIAALN